VTSVRQVLLRRLAGIALLVAGSSLLAPRAGGQATLSGLRAGITVQPESVTVGEPFMVQVRVTAPAGATIVFPDGPDSAAAVAAVASRTVKANPGANGADQTAVYTLVAWDVGEVPLGLADVQVTLGDAAGRIALGTYAAHVKSVLPADTTLRVPKPARPPFDVAVPWWKKWWPLLVALAVAALVFWLWWRRRRGPAAGAAIDPHAFAEREFGRIESLGLVDAGERGRHVALMVDVLRDYLALRLPEARASLTSSELAAALRSTRGVPHARLAALLDEADLVKFARRPLSPEHARALGKEARSIAREVETARTPAADADVVAPKKAAA
jgi:hypothetical protein